MRKQNIAVVVYLLVRGVLRVLRAQMAQEVQQVQEDRLARECQRQLEGQVRFVTDLCHQ